MTTPDGPETPHVTADDSALQHADALIEEARGAVPGALPETAGDADAEAPSPEAYPDPDQDATASS